MLEQNKALCRSEARGYAASLAQAHLRQKIMHHQDPSLMDIPSATNLGIIPPQPPCAGPPAITDDPILAELLQAAQAAGEEHISARHAKFQETTDIELRLVAAVAVLAVIAWLFPYRVRSREKDSCVRLLCFLLVRFAMLVTCAAACLVSFRAASAHNRRIDMGVAVGAHMVLFYLVRVATDEHARGCAQTRTDAHTGIYICVSRLNRPETNDTLTHTHSFKPELFVPVGVPHRALGGQEYERGRRAGGEWHGRRGGAGRAQAARVQEEARQGDGLGLSGIRWFLLVSVCVRWHPLISIGTHLQYMTLAPYRH